MIVYGFIRLGRAPCYHTWLSKIGVMGCAFSLIPLLAEWSAVPFHVMIVVLIVAGFEEMVIALLVPSHVGEIPTAWHAWRERRELRERRNGLVEADSTAAERTLG